MLPARLTPGSPLPAYVNVTREAAGYYVEGQNSGPVRGGEKGRDAHARRRHGGGAWGLTLSLS